MATHFEYLGIDWKDAEQAKAALRSQPQLAPEEKNFPDHIRVWTAQELQITLPDPNQEQP